MSEEIFTNRSKTPYKGRRLTAFAPSPLIGKPVPETCVIDRQGRIAYKQIGSVTPEVLEKTILPLIRKLRQ